MDRFELDRLSWRHVRNLVLRADREIARPRRRPVYADTLIVLMYLWAVWHDRTMRWACERRAYTTLFRPRSLPDPSTFCRRRRSERCLAILQRVHDLIADVQRAALLTFLDAKPLPVGACSKDREAKPGHITGGYAKGYKLHAVTTDDARIPVWSVQPMNADERTVARELLRHMPILDLSLADANYDATYLYLGVAEKGGALLTPVRQPPNTLRSWKVNCPQRLAALDAWEPWNIGGYVFRERLQVERTFGNCTGFAGGLGPLPAWVRTWPRVTQWVGAKIILYHARLMVRRQLAA